MHPNLLKAHRAVEKQGDFLSALLLRFPIVELPDPRFPDVTTEIAATDGYHVFFNTEWLATEVPWQTVAYVLEHELMHIGLEHFLRFRRRRDGLTGIAVDMEVERELRKRPVAQYFDPLREAGAVVCPDWADTLTAEQILRRLEQQQPPQQQPPQNGFDKHLPDTGRQPRQQTEQHHQRPPGRPQRQQSPDVPAATPSDEELRAAVRAAAIEVLRHNGKRAGTVPARLRAEVEPLLRPPARDWRAVLQQWWRSAQLRRQPTWARARRRSWSLGIWLPDARPELRIMIVRDTSGSMTHLQGAVLALLDELRQQTRAHVLLIDCDCATPHVVGDFGPDEPLPHEWTGGGGTDFSPPFTWLRDAQVQVDGVAYITDMIGAFPPASLDPGVPVVWIDMGSGTAQAPLFGEVVVVSERKEH